MKLKWLFLVVGLIFLQSCNTTQITASWRDSEYQARTYKKILVLAVTQNLEARQFFEQAVVDALQRKNINAIKSLEEFSPGFQPQEGEGEKVANDLRQKGYDGVITLGLLDVKEETRYNPGNEYYKPESYYDPFYGYYVRTYNKTYEPGYYSGTMNVYLESNLYDLDLGELIWTAQSETTDPTNYGDFASTYANVLIKDMMAENLFAQ